MKKLLLISLCLISVLVTAQINEPFSYPLRPGTKAWSNLKTEKERLMALQIPDSILSQMTTQALVISCINYPGSVYLTAYDNLQASFVILANQFNGLNELAKRSDAGECLINIYKISGEKGFSDNNLKLDGRYWTIKFSWIELLMAQNNLISSLSNVEKRNLLKLTVEKYKMKQVSHDYSINSLISTVFLMARVLHLSSNDEFELEYSQKAELKNFINTSSLSDASLIERIFYMAQSGLNKQK